MIVAAFDFDGTLTKHDTLRGYLTALVGARRLTVAVMRNLAGFARAARDRSTRDSVKERLLRSCIEGVPIERAVAVASTYAPTIALREDVIAHLRRHQRDGHTTVIVSASPSVYVRAAARMLGVDDVVATELEVRDGRLTGRYDGRNCRSEEKATRLEAWIAGREVELHAYGNSPDDDAMLRRADHPVWV
jgi:phosphatidylglycerophosphatase C